MNNNDKSNQGEMGDVEAQYQAGLEASNEAHKARVKARQEGAKKTIQNRNKASSQEQMAKDAEAGCANDGPKRPMEKKMSVPLSAYMGNAIYKR